jgi:hypothetical protein
MRGHLILGVVVAIPAAIVAAAPPAALSKVAGGLWEISGVPGASAPVRQCFADVVAMAQFEHRTRSCSRTVLSDKGESALISYTCGPGDFGQSQIDVITPRALTIRTQGISDQLPFNYVLEARRVGDCAKATSPSPH